MSINLVKMAAPMAYLEVGLIVGLPCDYSRIMPAMLEHIDFTPHLIAGVEQCRRLFHGRGHAYPGLEHVSVDWLPPVALITLYQEVDADWLSGQAELIYDKLPGCRSVQVQYRCRAMAPTEVVVGEGLDEWAVESAGLKFQVRLGQSQNIGLFLDMSNGWQWVRQHAEGRRVLNLFSYTCAFSIAALAGGARHVVNVDMSKAALSRGRDNHRLNHQDTRQVTFQGFDIFKSFSRLNRLGPYELLICDPPLFQKGSVDIRRDYKKIIRRLPALMCPGGLVMLCLNAPELDDNFLLDTVAEECPACRFIESVSPPDVFVEAQQGKGLKVLVFAYDVALERK